MKDATAAKNAAQASSLAAGMGSRPQKGAPPTPEEQAFIAKVRASATKGFTSDELAWRNRMTAVAEL